MTEPFRDLLTDERDFSCRRGGRVPYDDFDEEDLAADAELRLITPTYEEFSAIPTSKAAEMELFAARHAAGLHIRTGEPVNRREDAAARELDKELRRAAMERLK